MKHVAGVVLLALMLCAMPAAAGDELPAKADADTRVPFLGGFLQRTQIFYPRKVGGWSARSEKRYDDPAAGVSVRYMKADSAEPWLDVFFYPVGVIDEAAWKTTAEDEHAGVANARRQSGTDVDVGRLSKFDIGSGDARVRGFSSYYALDLQGRRVSSALVLAYDRMYVVKGRLSAGSNVLSRRQVKRTLEGFFEEMWPELVIASTGQCWMPLPVERLAEVPAAADVVATQKRDGAVIAYLTRDRVLAEVPDSAEARVMMMLGMSMQNRLIVGCDGPRAGTLEVPPGHGEIRIDYWPKPAAEPGSGSPGA